MVRFHILLMGGIISIRCVSGGEAGSLDGTYLKSVDKIGDETPLEVAERLMKFF